MSEVGAGRILLGTGAAAPALAAAGGRCASRSSTSPALRATTRVRAFKDPALGTGRRAERRPGDRARGRRQTLGFSAGDGDRRSWRRRPRSGGSVALEIDDDGGGQATAAGDSLEASGGGGIDASSFEQGPGPSEGALIHRAAGKTMRVSFSGLEPLIDTAPAATLTISGTAGADAITIDNGVSTADGRVRVNAPTFVESIEFANKTSVTVNGDPAPADTGVDTVTMTSTDVPTGLDNLTVDTGGDAGETIFPDGTVLTGVVVHLISTAGDLRDNTGSTDIVAEGLGIEAGTGVGTTPGPPPLNLTGITCACERFEAETSTGGIQLGHTGDAPVRVGGVTSAISGINVATSGGVQLTSEGGYRT